MQKRQVNGGFTLIELMITVAIVGLLAAIAYPSYTQHVRKSRRSEALQMLMNVGSRQQQYLLDTRSYADSLSTLNVSLSSSLSPYYTVSMTVSTATVPAFTVTAVPLGSQALDTCGTMNLNHAGAKAPTTCW